MSAPLIGGVPDDGHPAVVAIVERRPQCSSPEDLACSGTLIGPRAVLTAAHCLTGREPDELEVITGPSIDAGAPQVIAVWGARVHPGYDPLAQPAAQRDLAVLFLAEAPAAITPATWADAEPLGFAPGAELIAVAYGAVSAEPNAASGQRLTATSTIETLDPGAMHLSGGTSCGGDSGGALFFATAEGERLIGVIKGSTAGCTDPAIAMRTDDEAAFVREGLAAAAASTAPPRPPLDDAVDGCAATCDAHTDCPLGMLCLPDRGESHCGWRDVRTGALGAACAGDAPDCISVGQGAERACRSFTACADLEPEPEDDGGCCSTAGASGTPVALAAAVLVAFTLRRRRGAPPASPADRTRSCR